MLVRLDEELGRVRETNRTHGREDDSPAVCDDSPDVRG